MVEEASSVKNYTQVYVKNSVEAAQHYCNATVIDKYGVCWWIAI